MSELKIRVAQRLNAGLDVSREDIIQLHALVQLIDYANTDAIDRVAEFMIDISEGNVHEKGLKLDDINSLIRLSNNIKELRK